MEFTESNLFSPRSEAFAADILTSNNINPEMFIDGKRFSGEIKSSPGTLFGLERAMDLLLDHIYRKNAIGILVDDDADGMTSAAAMFRTLQALGHANIRFILHDEKGHGFSGEVEKIKSYNLDLLIVPDAGSNDFDEQLELLESIDLLIIDHHDMDAQEKVLKIMEANPGYSLLNNQLIFNGSGVNKNLVGAGMVYKFAQGLEEKTGVEISKYIVDLVAVGQIGDASDLADLEIQMIVREGLDNLNNGLLTEALKARLEKGQKIAPINMSFDIIPNINAVTRVGDADMKMELLKGLTGIWPVDELVEVEKRRKNKVTKKFEIKKEQWTHYAILMDTLAKLKTRQNKEIDKVLKNVTEIYNESIVILPLDESDIEYRSITGLVANKLVTKFNKPALVLVSSEDGTMFSGSARGHEKTFESFRQWCLETKLFDLAQGHDNAFGVVIEENNLDQLMDDCAIEEEKTEVVYNVNRLYDGETNLDEVRLVNDHAWLFGGSLQAPKFGYKNLIIGRNCISQRGSVVTFFDHGLEFIMYKQEPGLIDSFIETLGFEQDVVVNLVGKPGRNEWAGRVKEQIILDDFEMIPLSKTNLSKKSGEELGSLKFIDDGELVF